MQPEERRSRSPRRAPMPARNVIVTGTRDPQFAPPHAAGDQRPLQRGHRPHRRGRHRRRAAARDRAQRGRQRLRLRPRPRRPLFAGAPERLAVAKPRAAAPRRPARHLPDQRDRLLARAEELFGQLSGRVRRRRDQPHHARGAARDLSRDRRKRHLRHRDQPAHRLFLFRQRFRFHGLRRRHPRLSGARSPRFRARAPSPARPRRSAAISPPA